MFIYHYTYPSRWRDIKEKGLVPSDQQPLVFGLLAPVPEEWTANNDFPEMWNRLKSHMGYLLLKIEVDPQVDKISVIDRAKYESAVPEDTIGLREIPEDDYNAYLDTEIPLSDYLQAPEKYKYSLPEVIFKEAVPSTRISISEAQPLLEESLAGELDLRINDEPPRHVPVSERVEVAKRHVAEVPELAPWFEGYQTRMEHLQIEGVTEAMLK